MISPQLQNIFVKIRVYNIIPKYICYNCDLLLVISVPICPLSGEASHWWRIRTDQHCVSPGGNYHQCLSENDYNENQVRIISMLKMKIRHWKLSPTHHPWKLSSFILNECVFLQFETGVRSGRIRSGVRFCSTFWLPNPMHGSSLFFDKVHFLL